VGGHARRHMESSHPNLAPPRFLHPTHTHARRHSTHRVGHAGAGVAIGAISAEEGEEAGATNGAVGGADVAGDGAVAGAKDGLGLDGTVGLEAFELAGCLR
jgi:hypothetical protein